MSTERIKIKTNLATWVVVVSLGASVFIWGLLHFFLVDDVERIWLFGALPYTPAESIYSTRPPPRPGDVVPRQITPLPEAKPVKLPPDKGGTPW